MTTNNSCDFNYEAYTHNTTWSGPWASPQTGNCGIIFIANMVTMQLPLVIAAGSNAAIITMTTALPVRFRPSGEVHFYITIENNSAFSNLGGTKVLTSGVITIAASASFGANFATTGNCGINGNTTISWQI